MQAEIEEKKEINQIIKNKMAKEQKLLFLSLIEKIYFIFIDIDAIYYL